MHCFEILRIKTQKNCKLFLSFDDSFLPDLQTSGLEKVNDSRALGPQAWPRVSYLTRGEARVQLFLPLCGPGHSALLLVGAPQPQKNALGGRVQQTPPANRPMMCCLGWAGGQVRRLYPTQEGGLACRGGSLPHSQPQLPPESISQDLQAQGPGSRWPAPPAELGVFAPQAPPQVHQRAGRQEVPG